VFVKLFRNAIQVQQISHSANDGKIVSDCIRIKPANSTPLISGLLICLVLRLEGAYKDYEDRMCFRESVPLTAVIVITYSKYVVQTICRPVCT
jgi:hypothetical protein